MSERPSFLVYARAFRFNWHIAYRATGAGAMAAARARARGGGTTSRPRAPVPLGAPARVHRRPKNLEKRRTHCGPPATGERLRGPAFVWARVDDAALSPGDRRFESG